MIGVRSLFGHTVGMHHVFVYMMFFIIIKCIANENQIMFYKKEATFLIFPFKRCVLVLKCKII